MKKLISLILVLMLLCSSVCVAAAEESPVEKAQRLMTSYTWSRTAYNYLYLTNSQSIYPNFRWLSTIKLPNNKLVLTGDETGKVYLVYFDDSASGTACPGEISFSADEKTMLVAVVSGDLYGVFVYQRW